MLFINCSTEHIEAKLEQFFLKKIRKQASFIVNKSILNSYYIFKGTNGLNGVTCSSFLFYQQRKMSHVFINNRCAVDV